MRKFVCAAVVTVFAYSVATADTFFGRITKLTDKEVTFTAFKKGGKKGAKGEEKTLDLAKGCKFIEGGMFDKDDMKFTGGETIKLDEAQKLIETGGKGGKGGKGRFGVITTNDDNKVTEIRILKGFGGKGKGKKKPDDTQ
jgi:hypothetical protein